MAFEMILESALNILVYVTQPVIFIILWGTYSANTILSNYQITTTTINLYFLSSVIIGMFSLINIIITFQSVECYLNINLK